MPRGNGTGPMGMGAMTGRGAGYCAGNNVPGFMNPVAGRGFGGGFARGFGGGFARGGGRGFGFGRGWYGVNAGMPGYQYGTPAPGTVAWGGVAPEQEQTTLKNQLANLEQASADIRQRLADLENSKTDKK
ncbi:MAG: DUF5320 domain-containing protein [Lentisphaeria bacterium]